MKDKPRPLSGILKSGFVRSVITRVLAIFIIVSIIIAVIAFYSFTAEIRRSVLSDRQRQLASVERTISQRMEEITSIAYKIGNDPAFYLGAVENDPTSGREMAKMLERYLAGNSFIQHLAFCRTAEPDTIYTSQGQRSLSEFFISSLGIDKDEASYIVQGIANNTQIRVSVAGKGENASFSYAYPLPLLSSKPKAHVLMMIPVKEVQPLLEALLINNNGAAAVFDAEGGMIYGIGDLDVGTELADYIKNGTAEEDYHAPSGERYVLQKVVSETNGWIYISAMRHSDTLTGLANKQIAFIAAILVLIIASVLIMLASIIRQFKPISNLAAKMAEKQQDGGAGGSVVDESALLSDTIATLQDDSEQKQKYETAFYEAEAASKAKSAFLSSMSHDIRTPMNAIIGMTALARKHIGDQTYVDECLAKVQMSSEYLLDIINNVLDMSRIESGRIPIAEKPVLIPALIDNVVSLMTSSVEAKAQTLEVDISGMKQTAVIGDSVHMLQVFVNILSNAVKFTPEHGKILLKAYQTESDDPGFGSYVFSFTDTGVGIPKEFIARVFDTFTRANETVASQTEGTGLGMAIAKKLVELMNGTIRCESESGHGTTFIVEMRMRLLDEAEAGEIAITSERSRANQLEETAVDLTGKRIMLVEDNLMNCEIASRIISETGAEVVSINNGKRAVETFEKHPAGYFDLIFMDIQMPVMNGYEATAAIRSMDREDAASIPIYAMTANTFDEDVLQVKAAGMNGHVGKPYTPAVLHHVLFKVFQKSE